MTPADDLRQTRRRIARLRALCKEKTASLYAQIQELEHRCAEDQQAQANAWAERTAPLKPGQAVIVAGRTMADEITYRSGEIIQATAFFSRIRNKFWLQYKVQIRSKLKCGVIEMEVSPKNVMPAELIENQHYPANTGHKTQSDEQ